MNKVIFKMTFHTPVHFGEGRLGNSTFTFENQRLFSALFTEMLRADKDEAQEFFKKCMDARLLFSDAFPYIGEQYYLPRPLLDVRIEGEREEIKALKNLAYIPADTFERYLRGPFDPVAENNRFKKLGKHVTQQRVFVRPGEDNEPYFVGSYQYSEGSGLYFILTCKDEDDLNWFKNWMTILSKSGIGGKRTSGYGKFEVGYYDIESLGKVSERIGRSGRKNMSLGFSFPKDSETAVLDEGNFAVQKKSGFIMSESLNPPQKKKPFYGISSGSVFSRIYEGDIFDVSTSQVHPVYQYAKPMWMEVSCEEIL